MDKSRFRELIKRYQSGLLPDHYKAMVDHWDDAMERDKNAENTMTAEDRNKLKAAVMLNTNTRRLRVSIALSVAAAISIVIIIAGAVLYSGAERQQTDQHNLITAQAHETLLKVILGDSTIIWLKPHSTLIYPEKFTGGIRSVELRGEALFEVAKDRRNPFTIRCGAVTARVLGTSFNINTRKTNIEVTVLTGEVSLSYTDDQQKDSVIVRPKQKALYNAEQKQIAKTEATEEEETAITDGTEYNMNFVETPANEIFRKFESKFNNYNVKIKLEDPGMGEIIVVANLTDQSFKNSLILLSNSLTTKYEIKEDTIIFRARKKI